MTMSPPESSQLGLRATTEWKACHVYAAGVAAVESEIIVVGGGAVGLALGLDLGWRGRQVRILDEGNGVIEHPRTGGISVRTMEFCRRWGIAEAVKNNRFPRDFRLDTVFCTSLNGYELARVANPSMNETRCPPESPEYKVRCPQIWFDPMLSAAARAQDSVTVEYFTRVDAFQVQSDGTAIVTAHDVRSGAVQTYHGRFLVGADGPTSLVRETLGIAMSGNPLLSYSVNVLFTAPDMLDRSPLAQAERFIFVTPEGTWGNITVVDGRGLWRLTVIGNEERLDVESFDADLYVRKAFGRDDLEFEVHSLSPWRRTQLVADRYREQNVFLCGDAIHTMSPTGGFGVNTGIGDAVDLSWKLDAVLSGWGGENLLDSYEVERRPIGVRNGMASTQNFVGWLADGDSSALLESTPEGDAARQRIGAALMEATHAEWHSLGVILGYRYEDSPICVADGSPPPPDDFATYVPTARPGSRAPHVWLPDGTSTLDLYGRGFTLIHGSSADRSASAAVLDAAAALGVPAAAVTVPRHVCGVYEAAYVLVRPDGHVGWRGDSPPDDAARVWGVLRGAA
jgi:2-polyprenyl-6-methoxyphenol hydroxylase-like FAD-dependent oxidoreductase